MKGPAIFLAQFVGDEAPFDNLANMARWAGDLGYKGVQIPTWESSLIDLEKAAESAGYCDELKGLCAEGGVEISELSTHLQGPTNCLTVLRPNRFEASRRHAGNGRSINCSWRPGPAGTWD
jgi:sugar phosphate isomerase/epimerase